MKKIMIALLLMFTTVANARPMDHHDFPEPRPEVRRSYPEHRGNGGFLFPALIIGATIGAVVAANSYHEAAKTVIIEREPSRRFKKISEQISGKSAYSFDHAEDNWIKSCQNWKNDLQNDYQSVDASCGQMKCVEGSKTYCYSEGHAQVSRL